MGFLEASKLLFLAIVLGLLIGFEREYLAKKSAGTRTYALVCFGSCFFTLISKYGFSGLISGADVSRIAASIVVGIGFLGAGVIILHKDKVYGLTTAASLWASAAIGMSIGVGWLELALLGTFLMIFVLGAVGVFEYLFLKPKK